MNTLRGLFNGEIIPWERQASISARHSEIIQRIEGEERYFMGKMSLGDCQRLQALSRLHSEHLSVEEGDIFSYGFSLGLLMMFDVMNEAKLFGRE